MPHSENARAGSLKKWPYSFAKKTGGRPLGERLGPIQHTMETRGIRVDSIPLIGETFKRVYQQASLTSPPLTEVFREGPAE